MKRLAINIVILPPDSVMDLALKWNAKLRENEPANIVLGKSQYLPHISIAMGCIRADQFAQIESTLQTIAAKHRVLEIHMPQIRIVNASSDRQIIAFDVNLSEELNSLHETIVKAFRPLLTQDADESAINDSPPITSATLDWINHYIPRQSFDNFWPHITVGFGKPTLEFQPVSFQGSRLAICHLGNHCTCKTILAETNLRS
jgi:2'-5' RNA ligase